MEQVQQAPNAAPTESQWGRKTLYSSSHLFLRLPMTSTFCRAVKVAAVQLKG